MLREIVVIRYSPFLLCTRMSRTCLISLSCPPLPLWYSHCYVLHTQDLNSRFPNLYVPADFMRIDMEWSHILPGVRSDVFRRIHVPVPVVVESNCANLSLPSSSDNQSIGGVVVTAPTPPVSSAEGKSDSEEQDVTTTDSVGQAATQPPALPPSAALEPPRFTYVTPSPSEGYGVYHSVSPRPVKFNARVLVTLGMKELEADKVDHLFARRLRVLCGRRKKAVTLLGGAWCEELDGGNPMEDRGCLLNTARRTLMAQSLLDIAGGAGCRSTLTKLGEINYHRPQEEYNGKTFPEQEECTALYLCVLQPTRCTEADLADFENKWETFAARANGLHVGPTLNLSHDEAIDTCHAAAEVFRHALSPPKVPVAPVEVADESMVVVLDGSSGENKESEVVVKEDDGLDKSAATAAVVEGVAEDVAAETVVASDEVAAPEQVDGIDAMAVVVKAESKEGDNEQGEVPEGSGEEPLLIP